VANPNSTDTEIDGSNVGRNDPCPCGSGKKYKNCHLNLNNGPYSALERVESGMNAALDWLWTHHRHAVEEAVGRQFLGRLDDEEAALLEELDDEADDAFRDQLGDWVLAEAKLEVDGKVTTAAELILAPGGPSLKPEERAWMAALSGRPLSVYEVLSAPDASSFVLREPLAPKVDGSAPETLVQTEAEIVGAIEIGDLLAARLVPFEEGWHLAAALFPLEPEDLDELRPIVADGPEALSAELSAIFLELVLDSTEEDEESEEDEPAS
jgi:hypothetical protein